MDYKTYAVCCKFGTIMNVFEMFKNILGPNLLRCSSISMVIETKEHTVIHFFVTDKPMTCGMDLDDYIVIDPSNADKNFIDNLNICKISKEIRCKNNIYYNERRCYIGQ